ncbi:MAG TPA: ATP-binding protein, partial [Candidatus Acidoferrales bacterium]|nr:ATP-binding protein [Candidatus Acidoferrales bacterium]
FDANRLVAAEDVARSRENMRSMFDRGIRQSYEYVFVRKNGERFPVLLNSEPIKKDNKIVGARGIVIDISERKELERKLQEKERLAAIGTTAGMVGHDIRNPLQAMINDVYLSRCELAQTPQSKERKSVLENLQDIENNIDYINKIVVDLQDYARAIFPVGKETKLVSLCNEILLKCNLPDNIKVFFKVDKDAELLFVDPELLKRVLSNLILNAVQAMPEGGKLSVSAFIKDGCFVIEVKDTGVGIPEDVKAKMFTPMFTTKSKGQGLGLAVVKRLTEAMNGTVAFESEQGKGTKFIVRLPNKELNGKLVHK